MKNKLIFYSSQSPRSGHNFIADVITIITKAQTISHKRSETPIGPIISSYLNVFEKEFHSNGVKSILDEFYNSSFRKYFIKENHDIMIKNTSFLGVSDLVSFFPNDIHIISYRDPLTTLMSLFKGMRKKNNFKWAIKKTLGLFGIYHFYYSYLYSLKILKELPTNDIFIVKYEDVILKERQTLENILSFFESSLDYDSFCKELDGIKIINSSFFKEETKANSKWELTKKNKNFNPLDRSKYFNSFQVIGIKWGSYALRKKMGYV